MRQSLKIPFLQDKFYQMDFSKPFRLDSCSNWGGIILYLQLLTESKTPGNNESIFV